MCSKKVFGPKRQNFVPLTVQASMAGQSNVSITARAGFTCSITPMQLS